MNCNAEVSNVAPGKGLYGTSDLKCNRYHSAYFCCSCDVRLHGRSSGVRKVCCAWLIVFCSVTDPLDLFECVPSWSAYMLSCILSFHLHVPYLSAWCKACEWMDVSAAHACS